MQAKEIFEMWRAHAGIEKLHKEVKEEVQAGNILYATKNSFVRPTANHLNIILSVVAVPSPRIFPSSV